MNTTYTKPELSIIGDASTLIQGSKSPFPEPNPILRQATDCELSD